MDADPDLLARLEAGKRRAAEAGWAVAHVGCERCHFRWAAIAPVDQGLGSLACPQCGTRRSRVLPL